MLLALLRNIGAESPGPFRRRRISRRASVIPAFHYQSFSCQLSPAWKKRTKRWLAWDGVKRVESVIFGVFCGWIGVDHGKMRPWHGSCRSFQQNLVLLVRAGRRQTPESRRPPPFYDAISRLRMRP